MRTMLYDCEKKKSATTNRKSLQVENKCATRARFSQWNVVLLNVPSVVELTTMVKTRLDIQFHQRTKGRMPFDEKQKSPIHFHRDMVSGSVYKELVALYSMQEYMDVNPSQWNHSSNFSQTKEGERWVRFYFSALVAAKNMQRKAANATKPVLVSQYTDARTTCYWTSRSIFMLPNIDIHSC